MCAPIQQNRARLPGQVGGHPERKRSVSHRRKPSPLQGMDSSAS
jgi:hypothetical protein